MTTENLGTLVAKFELDTSQAQQATRTASASLDNLEKTTVKTGDAFRTAASKISPAGAAINGLASAVGAANPLIGQMAASATGLATTMATSGPLGLALAATGIAVAWLASKYAEAQKNAEEYHKAIRGEGVEAEKAAKSFAETTARRLAAARSGGGLAAEMDEASAASAKLQRNINLTKTKIAETKALISAGGVYKDAFGIARTSAEFFGSDLAALKDKLKSLKAAKADLDAGMSNLGALQIFTTQQDAAKKAADELAAALGRVGKAAQDSNADAQELADTILQIVGATVNPPKPITPAPPDENFARDGAVSKEEYNRLLAEHFNEIERQSARAWGDFGASLLGLSSSMSKAFSDFTGGAAAGGGLSGGATAAFGGLGAAGGAGLALELVQTIHGAITSGFQAVADKVGQFDPRLGGALGGAAPAAGLAVLSMGGVLSAPTALPLAAAAAGVALLDLSKNTESYGHAQLKVQAATDNLVRALEPFWRQMYPATMALQQVTNGLSPVLSTLAQFSGRNIGNAVFEGVKLFGDMTLQAAIAMGNVYNFLQEMAKREERIDVSVMEDALATLRGMVYEFAEGTLGDLLERRQRRAAEAVEEFTEALRDATYGLPTWYRYASAVYENAPNNRNRGSLSSFGRVQTVRSGG